MTVSRCLVTLDAEISVARSGALAIEHVLVSSRWRPKPSVLLRAAVGSVAAEPFCDPFGFVEESIDSGSGCRRHRSA